MSDKIASQLQAHALTAEENYAHARDHENLRAQVTSTLVAASFVVIGLALDKSADDKRLYFVAIVTILLSTLNVLVVLAHNNRFDRHVDIARLAKEKLGESDFDSPKGKLFSLSGLWIVVAASPGFAGIAIAICTYLGVVR
jgi:hypothetical protein